MITGQGHSHLYMITGQGHSHLILIYY